MDRLTLKANQPVTLIEQIAATSYTVKATDNNAVLGFTASAPVSVTLPPTLPQGFEVELLQMGTGQITAQGANMVSPQGFTTPAQYAALSCSVLSNLTGAAATWLVSSAATAVGANTASVTSYAAIRGTPFPASANQITISDPYKGGMFVPGAAGLRDNGGTVILDANGKPWMRVFSGPINAAWFWGAPTGHLGDGTGLAITAADATANPQWIGMPHGGAYPLGTTWAYVALQEWLYAGFAQGSTPGNVVWNPQNLNPANQPLWCPNGKMTINQGLFLSASGVQIEFASRASQIYYTGPTNVIPLAFDALSYASIKNLAMWDATTYGVIGTFAGAAGAPMVDLNWTGAISAGLKTESITFYDLLISGNPATSTGLVNARHGGDAQGDTVLFVNPDFFNHLIGFETGGQNACSIMMIEGDFQNIWKDGIWNGGGNTFNYGTSFQCLSSGPNSYPQSGQFSMRGADVHTTYGFGATDRNLLDTIRSESNIFLIDMENSTHVRASACACASYYSVGDVWVANSWRQIGMVAPTGTTTTINTAVMCVDDSGSSWFVADPASTSTHIINPNNPGWAVNQWVGYTLYLRWYNGFCFPVTITNSDANSVTLASPTDTAAPGGHNCKIAGHSGAVQPNWDSFPPGVAGNYSAQGWGFQVTAGNPLMGIYGGGALFKNGNYVAIPYIFAMTEPGLPESVPGALIGKIANLNTSGSTWTFNLVDAQGTPQVPTLGLVDGYGYWGAGIPDGALTWLPLDWDVMSGASRVEGSNMAAGKYRACIQADQAAGIQDLYWLRPLGYTGGLRMEAMGAPTRMITEISSVSGAVNVAQSNISNGNLRYLVGSPITVNMPYWHDGFVQETLLMFEGANNSATVTWGTNVKALAPTLNLAQGKTTVVKILWVGQVGAGGPNAPGPSSAWCVGEILGPF